MAKETQDIEKLCGNWTREASVLEGFVSLQFELKFIMSFNQKTAIFQRF